MSDTTVKKVEAERSPKGDMGQRYLVSGKTVSMRLWEAIEGDDESARTRDYETVGYVVSGRAELRLGDQVVTLAPGDSWLVPAGSEHSYRIVEPLTAIEACSPPAHAHGRDSA